MEPSQTFVVLIVRALQPAQSSSGNAALEFTYLLRIFQQFLRSMWRAD
jgi:hypothetical protein